MGCVGVGQNEALWQDEGSVAHDGALHIERRVGFRDGAEWHWRHVVVVLKFPVCRSLVNYDGHLCDAFGARYVRRG